MAEDSADDYEPRRGSKASKRQPEVVRTKHGRQVKCSRILESPSASSGEEPEPAAPRSVKLCWFHASRDDTHVARQSLRFIQPFIVHTCREHARLVDAALHEAVAVGKIVTGNSGKDAVCGVCGGTSGSRELVTCGERDCPFSFCRDCVNSLQFAETHEDAIAYSFDDIDRFARSGKWSCWVCYAERITSRPRERPRILSAFIAGRAGAGAAATATAVATVPAPASFEPEDLDLEEEEEDEYFRPASTRGAAMDEDFKMPDRFGRVHRQHAVSTRGGGRHRRKRGGYHARGALEPSYNIPLQAFVRNIVERLAVYQNSGWHDEKVFEVIGRLVEASHQFMQSSLFIDREDADFRGALMQLAVMIRQNTEFTQQLYAAGQEAPPHTIKEFREATQLLQLNLKTLFSQLGQLLEAKNAAAFQATESAASSLREREHLEGFCGGEFSGAIAELNKARDAEEALKQEEMELANGIKLLRRRMTEIHAKEKNRTDELTVPIEHSKLLLEAIKARERGVKKALEKGSDDTLNFSSLLGLVGDFSSLHFAQLERLFNKSGGAAKTPAAATTPTTTPAADSAEPVPKPMPPAPKQMTIAFYDPDSLGHGVPEFHCECSQRVITLIELIEELTLHPSHAIRVQRCVRPVDERFLLEAHQPDYLQYLKETLPTSPTDAPQVVSEGILKTRKYAELVDPENFDTFVTWGSWTAAMKACGAVCQAIDAVSMGECSNAFCAIRPPGHHAGKRGQTESAPSQGFCIINNVAIGAKYAVLARGYERVAVVDFDVHHGNGTQDVLGGDEHMLFISIHVYDEKKYFFPGTGNAGEGPGNVVNIPLRRHSGSAAYIKAFTQTVVPELELFQPQLILLSAGFDGHRDDPTRGLRLSADDFYVITQMLLGVAQRYCNSKVVSVLEGGYDISPKTMALQHSVRSHLFALMNQDSPAGTAVLPPMAVSASAAAVPTSPAPITVDIVQQPEQQPPQPLDDVVHEPQPPALTVDTPTAAKASISFLL